jgi:hypothetical protein
MNRNTVVLFEAGAADVNVKIGVMFGEASLDLPADFIIQPPIEVSADDEPGCDREQQSPAEKPPTEIDQSRENGRGPLSEPAT